MQTFWRCRKTPRGRDLQLDGNRASDDRPVQSARRAEKDTPLNSQATHESAMTTKRPDGRKRVIIESITPQVDCGRFPAKRTVGDEVRVEADVFTDGHDAVAASLLARREGSDDWTEIRMKPLVNDRWEAAFRVGELGRYGFKVQGWVDHFETWRRDLLKRIKAESDTALDYRIGAELVSEAAGRASGGDASWLKERAAALGAGKEPKELRTHATDP